MESLGGREEQFDRFFHAHQPAVHRYASRRLADSAAADDVVAETFVIAWRRWNDVPADSGLPWLLGVARRVTANKRRGADRLYRIDDRVAQATSASVARAVDPADAVFTKMRWAAALNALAADDRELITLIAWEGLTPGEAAAVLDCTPATARMRLSRARRRLREHLSENSDAVSSSPAASLPKSRGPGEAC